MLEKIKELEILKMSKKKKIHINFILILDKKKSGCEIMFYSIL